jgi:hypothetical protein
VNVHVVEIGGIVNHHWFQYQQHEHSPLNSDGQQFHQYQQHEQSPLTNDG